MSTISYSDARQNLARLWDKIIEDRETVILKRRGKEDLAVLPADDLSALQETLYLLSTPANASRLLDSVAWARAGGEEEHSEPLSIASLREALNATNDE